MGCWKVSVCPTYGENGFLQIALNNFLDFCGSSLVVLEDLVVALLLSIPHNEPRGSFPEVVKDLALKWIRSALLQGVSDVSLDPVNSSKNYNN